MDRVKKIREYLKPYLVDWAQEKIKEATGNPKDSLLSMVATLFQHALERQKRKPLWKPACLGLFHQMSSLITESYEYNLILADQQVYLDESMVIASWKPDFLYQNEPEQARIKKELEKQFIRLNSYEISYAKHYVFYAYRNIVRMYWSEHLDGIIKLEEFKTLDKDRPFCFLFGDYMGEIYTMRKIEEGL